MDLRLDGIISYQKVHPCSEHEWSLGMIMGGRSNPTQAITSTLKRETRGECWFSSDEQWSPGSRLAGLDLVARKCPSDYDSS